MTLIHNKYKTHYRRALLTALLGGTAIILFLSYFVFNLHKKPAEQVLSASGERTASQRLQAKTNSLLKEPSYGLPVHLKIPKLKVDANILQMGLTTDRDMEAPEKIEDVGWYKHGPRPGDIGAAVIDGHLGVGEPGVFVDLHKLQKGDTILVIDEKGQTISFVVREKRIYNRDERPNEVFVSSDGAHLNLITCTGTWDENLKGIPDRLVVFADKSS